jgi:hypothetical protein
MGRILAVKLKIIQKITSLIEKLYSLNVCFIIDVLSIVSVEI